MKSIFFFLFTLFVLSGCKNNMQETIQTTQLLQPNILDGDIIDLSHDYSSETIYWVTAKEFKLDTVFNGKTDQGFYYSANNFETAVSEEITSR